MEDSRASRTMDARWSLCDAEWASGRKVKRLGYSMDWTTVFMADKLDNEMVREQWSTTA